MAMSALAAASESAAELSVDRTAAAGYLALAQPKAAAPIAGEFARMAEFALAAASEFAAAG
jgi:hypothetical protein